MASDEKQSATERKVEKLTDEVREQQIDTQTDNVLTNVPPQGGGSEAIGRKLRGKGDVTLHIDRVGQDVILSIEGGNAAVFSGPEGIAQLQRLVGNAIGGF